MSKIVKVTYNADTLQTTITVDGKVFDTSRIDGKEIADWAYPFMMRKIRWNGFYDEMVSALGGEKAFDLVFECSEEALAELKEAWEDAPVNIVGENNGNSVEISYDENSLSVSITVNGEAFDTSRIDGKEIEDWVYPFMMRKVKWDGIFEELTKVIGSDEYDIVFSGTRNAMKVLMEECPETVAISFKKTSTTLCDAKNTITNEQPSSNDSADCKRKYVYKLSECDTAMKDEIGLKAVRTLVLMENNILTPKGFVIKAAVCNDFFNNEHIINADIIGEIDACICDLEYETGKKFGDKNNPLLLSVRVSPPFKCNGLLDAVLNIGMNDEILNSHSSNSHDERWALDCYCHLIEYYGTMVKGIENDVFSAETNYILNKYRETREKISVQALRELVARFKEVYHNETSEEFPQNPKTQLYAVLKESYERWDYPRANVYRRDYNLPFNAGMGIIIQEMIYGNKNNRSGTGVLFSRHPATGEKCLFGDFLPNAQGADVVSGISSPMEISQFRECFTAVYGQLEEACRNLEHYYHDFVDVEFTVENDKLFVVYWEPGICTAIAREKILRDLANEGLISQQDAEERIESLINHCLANGVNYYDRENFEKAVECFKEAINIGSIDAKAELGICYILGNGVPKDFSYGIQLIEESAEEGSTYASYILSDSDIGLNGNDNQSLKEKVLQFANYIQSDEGKEVVGEIAKGLVKGAKIGAKAGIAIGEGIATGNIGMVIGGFGTAVKEFNEEFSE